ncbi:hypothetical protein [Demequina sediminicola]|uniref:hypothetical protein n=1 Tax=Demequina sediminicola TaxID=1095026 RepID=UPI000783A6FD|nr:hypothetical protein [Demequina sediminicola]
MSTATTMGRPRRRIGQRISSALWGLVVMTAGAVMALSLSGYEIDFELAIIIGLAVFGTWMLLSAAVSGLGRKRETRQATAPVVEEPAEPDASKPDTLNQRWPGHAGDTADADAVDGESAPSPVRSDEGSAGIDGGTVALDAADSETADAGAGDIPTADADAANSETANTTDK